MHLVHCVSLSIPVIYSADDGCTAMQIAGPAYGTAIYHMAIPRRLAPTALRLHAKRVFIYTRSIATMNHDLSALFSTPLSAWKKCGSVFFRRGRLGNAPLGWALVLSDWVQTGWLNCGGFKCRVLESGVLYNLFILQLASRSPQCVAGVYG